MRGHRDRRAHERTPPTRVAWGVPLAVVRALGSTHLLRLGAPATVGLEFDSNLPDVRVAVGGPAPQNAFTAEARARRRARVTGPNPRQLASAARRPSWRGCWLAAAGRGLAAERGPAPALRELPVLAGRGLAGRRRTRGSPRWSRTWPTPGRRWPVVRAPRTVTVAVLNRGVPGFAVDRRRRGCTCRRCGRRTGRPDRGVDRPAAPDRASMGSPFVLQHWSQLRLEYALRPPAAATGGTRGSSRRAHDYNHPLVAVVADRASAWASLAGVAALRDRVAPGVSASPR